MKETAQEGRALCAPFVDCAGLCTSDVDLGAAARRIWVRILAEEKQRTGNVRSLSFQHSRIATGQRRGRERWRAFGVSRVGRWSAARDHPTLKAPRKLVSRKIIEPADLGLVRRFKSLTNCSKRYAIWRYREGDWNNPARMATRDTSMSFLTTGGGINVLTARDL